MAVMDVNSLNELKQIFKDIKPNDIKIVQNFLDMDKLTNISFLFNSNFSFLNCTLYITKRS